jgi:DNA mismatch repair protein MutS
MYEEYLAQYQTYKTKYGPKVAIFLMVGIFYEMYDERGPEGQTKTSFTELVDLLGLKVTVKKGEGPSGSTYDGLVAGIPDYSVHKWAGKLTQLGWTVVLVEQVKNVAGKVTGRQVERILTPGTHVEAADSNSMYLTFVHITMSLNTSPYLSAAAIDLTTGKLNTFETAATGTEDAWTSNDMVQFIELYVPREVVWSCEGPAFLIDSLTENKLRQILGCSSKTNMHQRAPLNSGAWIVPAFREEYLRERCGLKTLLPTHASLQLVPGSASETATLSLLNALQELWPSDSKPISLGSLTIVPWTPLTMMRLGENALVQLHMIVQDSARPDVLSMLDKCCTQMGHRGIRERLLKPSAEPAKIRSLLDAVEHWTLKPPEYQQSVQRRLRTVGDLDRLFRRVQQGTVSGTDLMNLDTSLKAVDYIAKSESSHIAIQVNKVHAEVFKVFDIKKVYEANDDQSLFIAGLVPSLDTIEAQIKSQMDRITAWIGLRAKEAGSSTEVFKIEFRERSLVIKAPRAVVQALKLSNKLPANTTAVTNKTSSYLESPELDQIYAITCRLRESLKKEQSVALVHKGTALTNLIFDDWNRASEWITALDVNLTLARVAQEYGYVKPEILDSETSSVHVEGLRHPLLEAQDRKIPYVQHTVSLGLGSDTGINQGWLLYGLNASGKSSLMRATGLAVLLAQGGCFVPASKAVIAPFQSIHTRIINTDNLWMGLSSFAVEMAEMRDIFRVAGPKSLVLGDELCSGTETTSATALVAAGLKGLLKRGARFLFATHLHGLSKIQEVAKDPSLKIWHLHVEYDHLKDKLVYHRSLREGSGSSLYGLEVAKAMRIPADILEDAIRFRKSLSGEGELLESVGSSWNTSIIRRRCEECGASEVANLEVHHIKERRVANKHGLLQDGSSVHAAANLAVLCDSCHDKHHAGTLEVGPRIQTSDGIESETVATATTIVTASVSGSQKKSKWSQEELATIETVCRQFSKLTNSALSNYLLNHHSIEISSGSLKKFRG